jgi:hypothetical protein
MRLVAVEPYPTRHWTRRLRSSSHLERLSTGRRSRKLAEPYMGTRWMTERANDCID